MTDTPIEETIAEPIEDTEPVDDLFEGLGGEARTGPPVVDDEIVPGGGPQHAPELPPMVGESETGLVDPPAPPAQDQEPIAVVETECMFYVYLVNGHWLADDGAGKTVVPQRRATFDDFRHAASTILSDLQAHSTAQATVQQLQIQQVMAQQAQAAAEIAKRTGIPGGGVDLSQLKRR